MVAVNKDKKNKLEFKNGKQFRKSIPVKQPFTLRALVFRTAFILLRLQGENLLLFLLSPDVARANII